MKPSKDKGRGETKRLGPDRQMDALVYALYLPAPCLARQAGARRPDEIQIVEGAKE